MFYVYFDGSGSEADTHRHELELFAERLESELGFKAFSYQDLIAQLQCCSRVRASYLKYLHDLGLRNGRETPKIDVFLVSWSFSTASLGVIGEEIAMFRYECSCCGKIHEGAPSFGYDAPAPFREQPAEVQQAGFLNNDLCTYQDEDGKHYFIRVCLEVPITGIEEPFVWGVWTSLSNLSFDRYVDTYDSPDTTDCYFGWLCNRLPYYPDTYAIKLDVRPRSGGTRPYVVPEKNDHPLSLDFHDGMTFERTVEIAEHVLHANDT